MFEFSIFEGAMEYFSLGRHNTSNFEHMHEILVI